MKKKNITLVSSLFVMVSSLYAQDTTIQTDKLHSVRKNVDSVAKIQQKEISVVDSIKHMFQDGKTTAQLRVEYASYNYKKNETNDVYATALGGVLKYELAELNGFNAGVAVYASHDIAFLTGGGLKQNSELSSSSGSYTQMGEAYINYRYKDFNFRAGRQKLDTPLADSDDIRVIQNSFEAYVATYNYDKLEFMAGHINTWQGVDEDLDNPWVKTGENGTNFGGLSYNNTLEVSVWYYNITKLTNAAYVEFGGEFELIQDVALHGMLQYLKESELDNSSTKSDIYGVMGEITYSGFTMTLAYNHSDSSNAKESFSGFGGGTLFTSMDTMILDEITQDRKAYAMVGGVSYAYDDISLLYAYGRFKGDKDSNGIKADISEQNIGFEYNVNDEFLVSAIYVIENDIQSTTKTDYDWDRAQVMVNYNF